jgi:outer membrane protein TolC
MKRSLTIFIFAVFSFFLVKGQKDVDYTVFNPVKDDIVDFIPTLKSLLDSAVINSPNIGWHDADIKRNKMLVRTMQREWTRNIGFQADVRHGSYDNVGLNESAGNTLNTFYSNRIETRFGVGAYIKLPLFDAVNRRNDIRFSMVELEMSEWQKEMKIREIREVVIKRYNELILAQNILRIEAEAVEVSRLQADFAENQFLNGEIEVQDYSRLKGLYFDSKVSFENAKSKFSTAYMLLQEATGVVFNM